MCFKIAKKQPARSKEPYVVYKIVRVTSNGRASPLYLNNPYRPWKWAKGRTYTVKKKMEWRRAGWSAEGIYVYLGKSSACCHGLFSPPSFKIIKLLVHDRDRLYVSRGGTMATFRKVKVIS